MSANDTTFCAFFIFLKTLTQHPIGHIMIMRKYIGGDHEQNEKPMQSARRGTVILRLRNTRIVFYAADTADSHRDHSHYSGRALVFFLQVR